MIDYPFVPKSTLRLARGQFWAIPLPDGRFAAGCVVGSHVSRGSKSARAFLAGVVDWVGLEPPTSAHLEGLSVARHGFAHIKTITTTGGEVLGEAAINFGALPESAESLSIEGWGFGFAQRVAEKLAASRLTGRPSGPPTASA